MACANGTIIINAVEYLSKNRDAARQFLPKKLHYYLDKRILVSEWYPEEDVLPILQTLATLIPNPGMDPYEWQGRVLADSDLEGVYAGLIVQGNPVNTLRGLSIFWSLYHDTGEERVVDFGTDFIITDITGFEYPSSEVCKTVVGWNGRLAELAGAKDVISHHESCVVQGAAACRFSVRWRQS